MIRAPSGLRASLGAEGALAQQGADRLSEGPPCSLISAPEGPKRASYYYYVRSARPSSGFTKVWRFRPGTRRTPRRWEKSGHQVVVRAALGGAPPYQQRLSEGISELDEQPDRRRRLVAAPRPPSARGGRYAPRRYGRPSLLMAAPVVILSGSKTRRPSQHTRVGGWPDSGLFGQEDRPPPPQPSRRPRCRQGPLELCGPLSVAHEPRRAHSKLGR